MNKGQIIKPTAYEWVKCANPNCSKVFPRAKKKSSGGHHGSGVRGVNALTCCTNCSKAYTTICKREYKRRISRLNHSQLSVKEKNSDSSNVCSSETQSVCVGEDTKSEHMPADVDNQPIVDAN